MMPMNIDTHDDKENVVPMENHIGVAPPSSSFKKRSSLAERGWEYSLSPLTPAEKVERNNLVAQIKNSAPHQVPPSVWLQLLNFDEKKLSETPSKDEIDALIDLFKRATLHKESVNEDFVPIWLGYVRVSIRNGDLTEAERILRFLKTRKIGLNHKEYYLSLAHISFKEGHVEKAREHLREGRGKGVLTDDQTLGKFQQKSSNKSQSLQSDLHNISTPNALQSLTQSTPSPLISPNPLSHNLPTPSAVFLPHTHKLPPNFNSSTPQSQQSQQQQQQQQQTITNTPSSSTIVRSANLNIETIPLISPNTNPNNRRVSLSDNIVSSFSNALSSFPNSNIQHTSISITNNEPANTLTTTAQSSTNINNINSNNNLNNINTNFDMVLTFTPNSTINNNTNNNNANNSSSPSKTNDTNTQQENASKKLRRKPLRAFMAQRSGSGPSRVRVTNEIAPPLSNVSERDDVSMQIDQENNVVTETKTNPEESMEREVSIQSMDSTLNTVTTSSENSEVHTDSSHSHSQDSHNNSNSVNTTLEPQFFSFQSQSILNSNVQIPSKPLSPQVRDDGVIQQKQPITTPQSQLAQLVQPNQVQSQLLLLQQQQRQFVRTENGNNTNNNNNNNNNTNNSNPSYMLTNQQLTPSPNATQSPQFTPVSNLFNTSMNMSNSSSTLTSLTPSSSNPTEQRVVSISPPSMTKFSPNLAQNENIITNTNFNTNINTSFNNPNFNTHTPSSSNSTEQRGVSISPPSMPKFSPNLAQNTNFNNPNFDPNHNPNINNPNLNAQISERPKETTALMRNNSSTLLMSTPNLMAPIQPVVQMATPLHFSASSTMDTNSEEHANRSFSHLKEWCGNEVVMVSGKPYIKLECIGKGGSSKVYKVISADLQISALKRVVLKGADPQSIASFKNEIDLLKRLRNVSARIIQLKAYEINLETGVILLVLEYGEVDLAKLISQHSINGIVQENFIRVYWQQMLEAVSVIHEERIVHGDLKPANFVSVQGNIKLIDFGIAKAIQNDTTNIARESATGTLNYMSPETINGTNVDGGKEIVHKQGRASDVWSLGCILYQMAYGKPPFGNLNVVRRLRAIADPNHVIEFGPHRNGHLVDTLKKCLQYTPSSRPTIPELLGHPFLISP